MDRSMSAFVQDFINLCNEYGIQINQASVEKDSMHYSFWTDKDTAPDLLIKFAAYVSIHNKK